MNAMNMKASPAQIRCIHANAKKLGLDNDALHDKCRAVTGQEHISRLTMRQAILLIDTMTGKKRDFEPQEHQRPISRASQEQIRVIFGLARKLGWAKGDGVDTDRLYGFIRSKYSVDHIDWLEPDDAGKCIEAMKAMVAGGRKERKGYSGNA